MQINKTRARAHFVQTRERETCMKSSQCTGVVGRDNIFLRRHLSEVAVHEPAMYEDHLRICHHSSHQQGTTWIIESIQHRSESLKGTSRATRGRREAGRGRESHWWWCPCGEDPRNQKGTKNRQKKERGLTIASSWNPSRDLEQLGRPTQRLSDPSQLDACSLLV